jgi:hypothetical protein
VLALQTRPFGVPRKSASRIGDRLIERHLRGLNPALVTVYRERIAKYEVLVADLARRSADRAGGAPYVLGLRPPAETPCVSQLELDPAVLTAGAVEGERLVDAVLGAASREASPASAAPPGPR